MLSSIDWYLLLSAVKYDVVEEKRGLPCRRPVYVHQMQVVSSLFPLWKELFIC